MTTPAFSHACIRAEPAALQVSFSTAVNSGYSHPTPSIETCLPSIVSCTSAFLFVVALKLLAPARQLACLPSLAADLESGVRNILGNRTKERTKGKSNCIFVFDRQFDCKHDGLDLHRLGEPWRLPINRES